ncbi:MAG TPA: hypothetical protein VE269_01455, partial [Gaiellaceae bacterium]|nr:hypothetical protein [Gaiellaceae bacterium]
MVVDVAVGVTVPVVATPSVTAGWVDVSVVAVSVASVSVVMIGPVSRLESVAPVWVPTSPLDGGRFVGACVDGRCLFVN